jgi:serine protease Do
MNRRLRVVSMFGQVIFQPMKLYRNLIGVWVTILVLVSGIFALRYIASAMDGAVGVRVDSQPLNRDPLNGNSYSPVVKKVAPSVVNIYSTRFVKQRLYRNPLMADPFFRQFLGNQDSGDEREFTSRDKWLGSGMIVTPDGYILTANHVVDGADQISVSVQNDQTEYTARVIGLDPPTDVAILKIDARNLPAVTLGDSDQLEVGDVVLAIGNPFGIGQTVTRGIISALGRSLVDPSDITSSLQRQYQDFIQTDAAINEGNSGGALVDAKGRLIGINDAIVSPSGASAGIGFAVPINLARSVMEGFLTGGKVARGYLGIDPQDIDPGLAKGFGVATAGGALLASVGPGSPAAKAGLLSGDVITAVNDKQISGAENLIVTVSQLRPGSQASVKIFRNGTPKTLTVTLGERTDFAQDPPKAGDTNAQPAKADALDGVQVQDFDLDSRRLLRAPTGVDGAVITDVDQASNSYEAGLRPGDVILEINHQPVTNAKIAVTLCKAARSDQIVVKFWRHLRGVNGGIVRFLSVDNTRRTN